MTQNLKEADGKSRSQRTETGYKADCVQASGPDTATSDTSIEGTAGDPVGFAEGGITYCTFGDLERLTSNSEV